jgi:hypothetical protein
MGSGRRGEFGFVIVADQPADFAIESLEQGDVAVVLEVDCLDNAVGALVMNTRSRIRMVGRPRQRTEKRRN